MEAYTVVGRIGEGAHGVVVRAKHNLTGQMVALKKIPLRRLDQGMPTTALREIKALQEINSQHDLKPANLLISEKGQLKIADLGLCRVFSRQGKRLYSHQVATRWYRAPELLYGARQYNEGVDLWAVGCIFGEMINSSPVFPGESDIDQLCVVLQILGTPSEATWPGLSQLPDYKKITFPESKPVPLEQVLPDAPPDALDLIKKFLIYSSDKRISANKALLHHYFFTAPVAAPLSQMPLPVLEKRPPPTTQEYVTDFPLHQITDTIRNHLETLYMKS
ncbi:cyclin-dependent kinase 20-like isoform X2 [Panulirus ornatus]|uniref:cyclin-dependent kinase 20-like isoform X2 n=1 Tax=Panulirus ornatus TaxID=150431 RepID=UPI003A8C1F5C